MDMAVVPRLSDAERRRRVEARAADLMAEAFATDPPKEAWWTEREVAIRDRAFQQAQDEVAMEFGAPSWSPPSGDAPDIDWSAPPRDGLREALSDRDRAKLVRDDAGAIAHRARTRLAVAQEALQAIGDPTRQIGRLLPRAGA